MDFVYGLKYVLMTIVGFILSCLVLCLLSPLLLMFFCYSNFVKVILKLKYGDEVYRATAIDVTHGRETEKTLPALNSAVRIRGDLDLTDIKRRIEKLILETYNNDGSKRYKRLLEIYGKEMGYNVWRSTSFFNIEDHIKAVALEDLFEKNELDDGLSWEEAIDKLLNRVGMQKFPEEIPQWNTFILDERNGHYTALFRFHHAISDGVFLSRMLCEDVLEEPCKLRQSYKPPSAPVKLLLKLWSFCLLPFGLLEIMTKNDSNPLHGPQLSGKKKFFTSKPIPMSKFKEIKLKAKSHLHAVMFSCVSFALSSHFYRKDFAVKSVTALSPIPLQNPKEQLKLKNKFAVTATTLPTPALPKESYMAAQNLNKSNVETEKPATQNSIKRLKKVQASLKRTQGNATILATNALTSVMCSLLPETLVKSLLSVKGCTMCISNLPGIPNEAKLWNGTQVDHLFWVPDRDPMGAGVSILSFNNHIRAGFTVDEALIESDVEGKLFVSDFVKEIENLLDELKNEFISYKEDPKLLNRIP